MEYHDIQTKLNKLFEFDLIKYDSNLSIQKVQLTLA